MAPAAFRNAGRLDALASYVATIASGHMLAFLHAAFSHEAEVESYLDTTEGMLTPLPEGRFWVSEVILKPRVTFASFQEVKPSPRPFIFLSFSPSPARGSRHSGLTVTKTVPVARNRPTIRLFSDAADETDSAAAYIRP